MTKIAIEYSGNLRCNSTHLKSGDRIQTDAPTDNNGKGEAFSPTDLLAAALSTCMITVMGIAAASKGFELGEVQADVEKIMGTEPRRVAEVKIAITISDPGYGKFEKDVLETAALNCPVAKSLNDNLIQAVHFDYKAK